MNEGFVETQGSTLHVGGRPVRLDGVNLWYAAWLGAPAPLGDPARLDRELDRLAALNLTTVRIMAVSEGPSGAPQRVSPPIEPRAGHFDPRLLAGLDRALAALAARDMRAIVCLGNFWFWSGGFAQLRAWAGAGPIPYPRGATGWDEYARFTAGLYRDTRALALQDRQIAQVVGRVNRETGIAYADDPTIAVWELANEPRGTGDPSGLRAWIARTAARIKALAPRQLVATGSEGETATPAGAGLSFVADHAADAVDVTTVHLWPENWGIYDPLRDDEAAFARSLRWSKDYVARLARAAADLGKPVLLEELGLARDGRRFDGDATTARRDRFFAAMLDTLDELAQDDAPVAGMLPWAWTGEGVPTRPGGAWQEGHPLGGDPPHEPQGWYGIRADDTDTAAVLSRLGGRTR